MASVRERTAYREMGLAENQETLKAEPASIVNRFRLADNLFGLGRYDEVEVEYHKVQSRAVELTSLENENKEYRPLIGRYDFRLGNYRRAAEWFERT
jgi:hypothetical protein